MNRRSILFFLMFTIFIGLFILPFIPMILTSIGMNWRFPSLLPTEWSGRAWAYVFSIESKTWQAIGASLWIACCVTLINLAIGIPAANALARLPFKAKGFVEWVLFAPIFVPAFAAVMGIHFTFIQLGLTETIIGVILVHLAPSLPYVIRAIVISYQTLNHETEHAARMLGAGWLSRFSYVVIPHLLPGIIAGASLSMLISLSQYIITLFIGGGQVVTLPILLFPFISGGDPAIASAYTLLFSFIAILLLVGLDRGLNQFYARKERGAGVKT